MRVLLFLLVVVAVGVVVWRRRQREGPTPPAGVLASLVDQGRDVLAPLYPSRPLSRRTLPRRLLRAAEQTVTVGVSGMVLVPTRITIHVNPEDLEPFTDAMEWLRRDVGDALRQRAQANGWVVPDGPHVDIVADDERPLRLPRAVGRIDAFKPGDVATLPRPAVRPGPPPAPAPSTPAPPAPPGDPDPDAEPTGATSVVLSQDHALDQPTVPADPAVHVRLVALGEPRTDAPGDLNALLVASTPLVVGRSREADLQVKDRQVSARHCALTLDAEQGTVHVRDMGSTNGTYVDDQRIDGEATLAGGTVLRIGSCSWRVDVDSVSR